MAYVNEVYEWEGDATQPYESAYTWRSKKYLLPVRTTFTCGRVIAEFLDREDYWATVEARDEVLRRNRARISAGALLGLIGDTELGERELDGDILEDVPEVGDYSGDYALAFKVYCDDVLRLTREIYVDVPFRLGDGFRGRTWEVEVIGNVIVKRVDLASSMEELKTIIQSEE